MARTTPENCPLALGDLYPISHRGSFGFTRVFVQNGLSIGSAVFAQLTVECPITLQCAATSLPPKKLPFDLVGSGLPSNTWYIRPTRVIIQNAASRSVQPFLYGSQILCCQWGTKPTKLSLPLGISSASAYRRRTNPRPKATCTEILVEIACVVPEISSRTDRQTHTDILITILRHRSRGRSKNNAYVHSCSSESCGVRRCTHRDIHMLRVASKTDVICLCMCVFYLCAFQNEYFIKAYACLPQTKYHCGKSSIRSREMNTFIRHKRQTE